MSVKMKGLLKGFKYVSQIFEEEEKEVEIQIGFPTDVKHVAHIGWDGPSASSPSWMTEFKETPTASQANGDIVPKDSGNVIKNVSQESSGKKSARDSVGRDLPSLPKSSRRQPSSESIGSVDSPTGSPSQKSSKSNRRRSKQKENSNPKDNDLSSSIPNVPKKSRRKKSKDGEDSNRSSRSKDRGSRRGSRHGSDDGSVKHYNSDSALTV